MISREQSKITDFWLLETQSLRSFVAFVADIELFHPLLRGIGTLFLGFDQKNKRQQNQHNSGEGCEGAGIVQKGYSP